MAMPGRDCHCADYNEEEGIDPATVAAAFGFDSLDAFAEWLGTLSPAAREIALAPLAGGGS